MKKLIFFCLLILTCLDAFAARITVSDYFQGIGGIRGGNTQALAYSPVEAAYYSGGAVATKEETFWVIRKGSERGGWKTVFSVPLSKTPFLWAGFKGFAFDRFGRIFAISRAMDRQRTVHWIVHRSSDRGASWQVVDDFTPFSPGGLNYPYHIAAGPFGEICIAGKGADTSEDGKEKVFASIVRCSWTGGASWFNSDWVLGAWGSGISFDRHGEILTSGYEIGETSRLLTRLSRDHGKTWKTVDTLSFPGQQGGAISSFIDAQGTYYALGSGWIDPTGTRRWFIRRSGDKGRTWQTVDQFSLEANKNAEAYEMTQRPSGELLCVGYALDSLGRHHMILRRSRDQGRSWHTVVDHLGVEGRGFYGHNLSSGRRSVMVSGASYLENGRAWLTVKYEDTDR